MPIEGRVDASRRRVFVRIVGDFSAEDIFALLDSTVRDPGYRPGFDILSDHTEIGAPLTTEQAKAMAAYLHGLGDQMAGARLAVVTEKAASFGMMRMLSVLLEPERIEVRAFARRDEAESWLSAPRPGREPLPVDRA